MEKTPKAVYYMATLGSKTARGGEVVTASTGMVIQEHKVAQVGDTVRYPGGSETAIVSGAGFAMVYAGVPVAIVGSELENGDHIIDSRQTSHCIAEYAGDPIPGLLDRNYTYPYPAAGTA